MNKKKICMVCRRGKELCEFEPMLETVDGLSWRCRACRQEHEERRPAVHVRGLRGVPRVTSEGLMS